jgi:hypothetical protein
MIGCRQQCELCQRLNSEILLRDWPEPRLLLENLVKLYSAVFRFFIVAPLQRCNHPSVIISYHLFL